MATWTAEQLRAIDTVDEIGLASRRADGTLRPFITMWMAAVDGELYVRSAHGADNPWYRRALASGEGRIRAGGVEADVTFETADPDAAAAIDARYHEKYDRYGARIVGSVVGSTPTTSRSGSCLSASRGRLNTASDRRSGAEVRRVSPATARMGR